MWLWVSCQLDHTFCLWNTFGTVRIYDTWTWPWQMLTTFIGNSTFAAITAIVAANLVLVAYIITAVLEDRTNATSASQTVEKETKKDRWNSRKTDGRLKSGSDRLEYIPLIMHVHLPAISPLLKSIVGSISIAHTTVFTWKVHFLILVSIISNKSRASSKI